MGRPTYEELSTALLGVFCLIQGRQYSDTPAYCKAEELLVRLQATTCDDHTDGRRIYSPEEQDRERYSYDAEGHCVGPKGNYGHRPCPVGIIQEDPAIDERGSGA